MWQVIWPGIVLGLGLGMCFPILSAAALTCVPARADRLRVEPLQHDAQQRRRDRDRLPDQHAGPRPATSIRPTWSQHFSAFDAWRLSNELPYYAGRRQILHFCAQIITGQKQNLGMIYGAIQQQSAMLAFNDLYRILTVMAVLMIPSFLLFRGAKMTGGGAAH